MRAIILSIVLSITCIGTTLAQTNLAKAREFYNKGEYAQALPLFEAEFNAKPNDASINHWYAVCLYETGGDMSKAEKMFTMAAGRRVKDSNLYLGMMYTGQYRFTEAEKSYDSYEKFLRRRGDETLKENLEKKRKELSATKRIVTNTEDIQIIDSVVMHKQDFLKAIKLSPSGGKLDIYNEVFESKLVVNSTVYFNEMENKIYYARPQGKDVGLSLYSMEKLLDDNFSNEKKLSKTNFDLTGNLNYPFVLTDGVTIYFAAEDQKGLGGYDLYISRYNLNNDTYLVPERLNPPFNSPYNDYMMVIDEEKGVGWFASDRFQKANDVCIYTFIPNSSVKMIDSEDEKYLANRSLITSIKDTWQQGADYSSEIARARKEIEKKVVVKHDFEFVINDDLTYYQLTDFKNNAAKDLYKTAEQTRKKIGQSVSALEKKRDEYARNPQSKAKLTDEILKLETDIKQLNIDFENLEISARNKEVGFLHLNTK